MCRREDITRERVAASARRGLAAVRRFKRAGMAAIALGAGVLAFAAPADVARGVAWLQAQVQTDGSLPGPLTEGAHQQARCETAATLIKLAGNSAQVASLLAALESPDRATETAACWQRLRQKLGQTTLGADLGNRRVSSQGYAAYGSASAPNALDTGWALQGPTAKSFEYGQGAPGSVVTDHSGSRRWFCGRRPCGLDCNRRYPSRAGGRSCHERGRCRAGHKVGCMALGATEPRGQLAE